MEVIGEIIRELEEEEIELEVIRKEEEIEIGKVEIVKAFNNYRYIVSLCPQPLVEDFFI